MTRRYGSLIVLTPHDPDAQGRVRKLVQCECGQLRIVVLAAMQSGSVTSCGCQDSPGRQHADGIIIGPRPGSSKRQYQPRPVMTDIAGAQRPPYQRKVAPGRARTVAVIGDRYGERIIVAEAEPDSWGKRRVIVECGCGAQQTVNVNNLRNGSSDRCHACSNATNRRQRTP